jgi:hypothetical protein
MPENLSLGRWSCVGLLVLLPVLWGCSAGRHSAGFVEPELVGAYIPLSQHETFASHWAAGFAIAPNIGVTNDHNLRFIPPDVLLARSRDYDLLFFRTDKPAPVIAKPQPGEEVIA